MCVSTVQLCVFLYITAFLLFALLRFNTKYRQHLAWVHKLINFINDVNLCDKSISQFPNIFIRHLHMNEPYTKILIASEEVTIQLLKSKCLLLLPYATEVCNLTKRDLQSLDFTINRFFMQLFRTSDINVVTECQLNFHFQLPTVLLEKRREKFVNVYGSM